MLLIACAQPESAPPEDSPSPTTSPTGPGAAFDRWCQGADWRAGAMEGEQPELAGSRRSGQLDNSTWRDGTVELSKIVPSHPFHVRSVRVNFAASTGEARIRLMRSFGRSYPGGWPDLDADGVNLIEPTTVSVDSSGKANDWTEIDVSAQEVYLEPTQHYVIVNEYLDKGGPTVALASVPDGAASRALIIVDGQDEPYGMEYDFRMELEGEFFCAWEDEARWFQPASPAFADDPSSDLTVADVDGDGHQDVVSYGAGPRLWLGDGQGGFTEAADPWPEAMHASWMLFGDVDNDGDADAFAANYVGADNDGDGSWISEGDCDDSDAEVEPGEAEEVNGRDDDCDGVADDGSDTGDADADGVSIAAGDCNDGRADVGPAFAELEDSVDNDCDLVVDEDFPSRILLNDGSGHFSAIEAGVEVTEPSTAGGFGDADGDGNLDLFFGNWLAHYPDDASVPNRFYLGGGDGRFTDAFTAAGLALDEAMSVYGVEWTDYDDDGDFDIFVGTYHLYDNQLWENQGDGSFIDVALEKGVAHDEIPSDYAQYPGGHTYGGDFGDWDNDGDLDFYQANLSHPRTQPWADPSMFCENQGPPDHAFDERREEVGLEYDEGDVAAQWADFDNDMDLDLVVASLYSNHYSRLYRNDGGLFTDVSYEAGLAVHVSVAVIWVDVDEDGDEDLVVGDGWGPPYGNLFLNTVGQDRHWVDFVLEGTTANRDAVGARVVVEAGGVAQVREITDGNGLHNTQKPRRAHFGLGDHDQVDAVRVRWPGGVEESFSGVGVDRSHRLVQGSGVAE